ncbi:DUF418 domain-containing protein [Halobacterium salinarum]|uniref:DUF418 domain-containing protein n=1 Tax=Halobacterium salinarum TaxID=2242 RepID=UPI001F1F36C4|nr:DUF418 domain-containing protein [Halobacterium salinarum]MCF2165862.1 DUF418 domain-containing protein [Halobacterium salinarum]MCF2167369.1 DUF418 domain-containing protein [Halobacterium salinarum]
MTTKGSPTAPTDRIIGLDTLRGVALLGILVINIRAFSMPEVVLLNPTAYGDFTGMNYWAWLAGHLLVKQKFITVFTLLFGTGVAMFVRNRERDGDPAVTLHVRRSLWLIAFGLVHAYVLWYGDILVAYGVTALFVVAARNWETRDLLLAGTALLAVPTLLTLLSALVADPGVFASSWQPADGALQAQIEAYRGGWSAQLAHRVDSALGRQTTGYIANTGWRTAGLMLYGMALFHTGVTTNDRSRAFYRRLVAVGGTVGLAVTAAGVWYITAADWAASAGLLWGQFNYWGSVPLAGAYLGAVMLVAKRWPTGVVTRGLAAVGRTAFSNYILQTVVATAIFYGHGLGLFGRVSRVAALGIVAAVWVGQIALSVLWVRYFQYGPLEWLWRALTYRTRPPMRATD